MKKKLGFALGAGGSRGVAHIGFLKAMEEEGITPDCIAGCSMGSVVGAAYASGMTIKDMERAVEKLRILDLIIPTSQRGGLFETKRIRKLLERYIGDIEFDDLKIPYRCIAVDMITQSVVEFHEGKVLDGVIASSSIPAVFKPTQKDGMRLVDGGVLERVPYRTAKEMGADVVVAVDVLGWRDCQKEMPTTLGVILEIMDLMDNARTKNNREKGKRKKMYDVWLEPDLGDMNQYSCKKMNWALEKGYEIGKANAEKIKKLLD
jgi:NTE family protein